MFGILMKRLPYLVASNCLLRLWIISTDHPKWVRTCAQHLLLVQGRCRLLRACITVFDILCHCTSQLVYRSHMTQCSVADAGWGIGVGKGQTTITGGMCISV